MLSLVPRPAELKRHSGFFALDAGVRVVAGPGAGRAADLLTGFVDAGHGPEIRLSLRPGLGPEEYELDVTEDLVTLVASAEAGLFHGVQTLRQLGPDRWPCLRIRDRPRLAWRGVLLDVARHFMPLGFLYEFVDLIALHKYNVLHLHLTDDQGWRLEIDGRPKLTDVGAWRSESMVGAAGSTVFDGVPHGGFYTRAELRGLVGHAAARGVRVVPEIDLPGHVRAALAAYPELGNRPERPLPVWTEWGISPDILGMHDAALDFCRDVLTQTAEIFPSRHLHIGGDECPTTQWETAPAALARAQALGLRDTAELHAWFLGELHGFLGELGRQSVCWDETGRSPGSLPPAMTVASWRDAAHGAQAVARGHQVIMAPHTSTYFDYPQTDGPGEPPRELVTTLADVHAYDPLEGNLPAADPDNGGRPGVIGTQAQLWTEHAPTPDHVRQLAFPRLCALAESAWSPGPRDYADFEARLAGHLDLLRALNALPKERVRFPGGLPALRKPRT
ncbi:beta-N-acetylhexosaminidase [Amycolatopsis sp. cmx-8-4]|uniref:beta-N-acetylhexosaminidase n=1 Tax=Amycolatopsis sp. cmx-8-4 TaxID=2790947 RepID=UPI0039796853